jgi:hypothetical protein
MIVVLYVVGGFSLWYVVGLAGFVFWWTRDWDLNVIDLMMGSIVSLLMGPFTWIAGALVHGDGPVLIRRRK